MRQGSKEYSYGSLDTLMKDTGLAKKSALTENLQILKDYQLIRIDKAKKGQKTNHYYINYAEVRKNIQKYESLDASLKAESRSLDALRKRASRLRIKQKREEYRSKNAILGITSKCPVTLGHPSSDPRSPVQSPRVTRPVTQGHPNINIIKTRITKNRKTPLFLVDDHLKTNRIAYEIDKLKAKVNSLKSSKADL